MTSACLELVNQAQSYDIVGRDTGVTSEAVVVQQVDFVVNVGGHVFVEVVGRAHVNIFQDILVAVAFQILTFRLQVSNGRTQTEIELVLCSHFEVLCFVSKAQATSASCVVGLSVLSCQVDVVRVVFQAAGVGFSIFAVAQQASCVLIVGTFRVTVCETSADAVEDIVSYGSTETVAVLFVPATTVVGRAFAADAAVLP